MFPYKLNYLQRNLWLTVFNAVQHFDIWINNCMLTFFLCFATPYFASKLSKIQCTKVTYIFIKKNRFTFLRVKNFVSICLSKDLRNDIARVHIGNCIRRCVSLLVEMDISVCVSNPYDKEIDW